MIAVRNDFIAGKGWAGFRMSDSLTQGSVLVINKRLQHEQRSRGGGLHNLAVWPGCVLLTAQLHIFILISLKLTMEDSKKDTSINST